jgi:hypothetical protein
MVTLDQLKTHIAKAKTEFAEAAKKNDDRRSDPTVRQKLKKIKRLERKVAKLNATAEMAEEKKKPKKDRKSAAKG